MSFVQIRFTIRGPAHAFSRLGSYFEPSLSQRFFLSQNEVLFACKSIYLYYCSFIFFFFFFFFVFHSTSPLEDFFNILSIFSNVNEQFRTNICRLFFFIDFSILHCDLKTTKLNWKKISESSRKIILYVNER